MEEEARPTIEQAVARVQRAVVVPKARYNKFGKFSYRSFEDIVAALKEPCRGEGIAFTLDDSVVNIGERYYVRSECRVFFEDGHGGDVTVAGYAREAEHKTGSDDAQVTGMASSYARKYALCGAFAIDGTSDPDALAERPAKEPPAEGPFEAKCRSCGTAYTFESRAQYEEFVKAPGCCAAPSWAVV